MVWIYTIVSVMIVSFISLVGVITFSVKKDNLNKVIILLVSLSAGTLMGDAFLHLIPEAYSDGNNQATSLLILSGILLFFILEKVVSWRHCHEVACEDHPHTFSYMILTGDLVHNFIDGLVIGASYLVSIPVGIATTMAVVLHEIPQEIGDFGSLIYGGFSRLKALIYNFVSALSAVAGALMVIGSNFNSEFLINILVPFAAGGFIYIAGSDLIPELHKNRNKKIIVWQIITFVLGMALMFALLFLE